MMGASDLSAAKAVTLHRPAAEAPQRAVRWSVEAVQALLDKPFNELLFEAQSVHRAHFPEGDIELATLLSVKTGGCPENCGYCPQSAEFDTGVKAQKLMEVDEVVRAAQAAKDARRHALLHGRRLARAQGPRRREGGGAGREPSRAWACRPAPRWACWSRSMRTQLKAAGLDYYNHNLDTAPEYYGDIVDTRTYQDRLDTLAHVRAPASACAAAASSAWARRRCIAPG